MKSANLILITLLLGITFFSIITECSGQEGFREVDERTSLFQHKSLILKIPWDVILIMIFMAFLIGTASFWIFDKFVPMAVCLAAAVASFIGFIIHNRRRSF